MTYRSELNDNRRLTTRPHKTVWGNIVDLSADLSALTPQAGLTLTPRLHFMRYQGEPNLDSNDQYLDMSSHYDTERDSWRMNAAFARDTTLTSELLSSGLLESRKRRVMWNVNPEWVGALTPKDTMTGDLSYTSVSYLNAGGSGLVDYSYLYMNLAIDHQLSPRDRFDVVLNAAHFDTPQTRSATKSFSAQVGYQRAFSETLSAHVGIGLSRSSTTTTFTVLGINPLNGNLGFLNIDATSTQVGLLFDAGLTKQFERTQLKAAFTRNLSPSGIGFLVERDDASLSLSRRVLERLSAGVTLRYIGNRALQSNVRGVNRDFAEAEASVSWRLSPKWSIGGTYSYLYSKLQEDPAAANSNAVMLNLIYNGQPWSVSR